MKPTDKKKAEEGAEAIRSFLGILGEPNEHTRLIWDLFFEVIYGINAVSLPGEKGQERNHASNDLTRKENEFEDRGSQRIENGSEITRNDSEIS